MAAAFNYIVLFSSSIRKSMHAGARVTERKKIKNIEKKPSLADLKMENYALRRSVCSQYM